MFKSISMMPVIIPVMLLSLMTASVQETQQLTNLIYTRPLQQESDGFQLVSHFFEKFSVFEISRGDCFDISPDKSYLAINPVSSTELDIYNLSNGELIDTISNEALQANCNFKWKDERTILLSQVSSTDRMGTRLEIDILDGSVSPEKDDIALSVSLLDLLQDDFRILSPDRNLVVYNQCEGGKFNYNFFTNDQICSSEERVVIYDRENRQIIHVLEDAQQGRFALNGYETLAFSFAGIAWSPSGRYLAYLTSPTEENTPSLKLFDTDTQKYSDFDIPSIMETNKFKGFRWQADESSIAFWLIDYQFSSERIAVANIETRAVDFTDSLYNLPTANWTLTSTSVVFIDDNYQLVDYNLNKRFFSIIDTNVWNIW